MRIKHATMRRKEDGFEFFLPSQFKARNTECSCDVSLDLDPGLNGANYNKTLVICGYHWPEQPTFENIQEFEDYCNRAIAEHITEDGEYSEKNLQQV